MRICTRKILKGRQGAALAGLTLATGGLVGGRAAGQTTQPVTITYGTAFMLPNDTMDVANDPMTAPVGQSQTRPGHVSIPSPVYAADSSFLPVSNSVIGWTASFHADISNGGTAIVGYSASLEGSPVSQVGGYVLPVPNPNDPNYQSPEVSWFEQNVSHLVPPVVAGRRVLHYSSTVSANSYTVGSTATTGGIFMGLWTYTDQFVPANPFTPPNPPPNPPPPGGQTGDVGWGDGWGNNPVPNGSCASAYLGQQAAPINIFLTSPVTLGSLLLDSTTSYTLNGPSTLTLDCTSATLHVNQGSHTINAPIHFATDAIVSVTGAGNTLTTAGTMTAASGVAVEKIGDGTWAAKHVRASALTVSQGTVRAIANNSANGTSRVETLTVNDGAGARFDLARNHLVVDYATGGASPFAEVARLIKVGYNGGDWQGAGLTSSDAAAVHAVIAGGGGGSVTALGYAEASVLGVTTFGGQTVDADAVLVRYTLAGDTNLDGTVNFTDLLALARNYGQTGKTWADGDFNYDGVVNFDDNLALSRNYNQSLPADPAFAPAIVGSPVPEPGTVGALAAGAVVWIARRRRRRHA